LISYRPDHFFFTFVHCYPIERYIIFKVFLYVASCLCVYVWSFKEQITCCTVFCYVCVTRL